MNTAVEELLAVLKKELQFLEKGGYRNSARAPWRPQFIFQDSPTCLNFDPTKALRSCSDCTIVRLVPEDMRSKRIPCRYIPLNEKGQTIDSFYRTGTQAELEEAFGKWLHTSIARLEEYPRHAAQAQIPDEVHVHARATQS